MIKSQFSANLHHNADKYSLTLQKWLKKTEALDALPLREYQQ
jgi:hypothetical protein